MKCLKPIKVNGNFFNCGYCRSCRINKTSQWALRLIYELDNWDCASFVTLTYNDENLPKDFGLHKDELTTFLKALRYDLSLEKRKFKYFACGEYGDIPTPPYKHGRPHFHLILFGLNPDPYDNNNHDRQLIANNWLKCDSFMWRWKNQNNAIDYVNRRDINYVCGYVQKKLNGELGADVYADRQRPFMTCSKSLGLDYFVKNQNRFFDLGYCLLNGRKIAIPKYYRDKLNYSLTENNSFKIRKEKIDSEVQYLYSQFKSDMKKRGLWQEENPIAMNYRFESWYLNREYELAFKVEKSFLKKSRLRDNGV